MAKREWFPWYSRSWLRIPVAQLASEDLFCSGYRFARISGRIVKFWTRKGAQAFADKLNGDRHD